MMVSKKNQCADCGTEMEFHFSSGNYVCIKCSQDDRDLVLSSEEKRRIEFREKMEREQKQPKLLNIIVIILMLAPYLIFFFFR